MVGINLEARIRERAYQIWEREGRPYGRHLEHWRRAEQEVESQAEQGDLKRSVERPNPAPGMQPSSVAAAAGTETAAKEAKRTVKRKQTRSEAKAPRTRRSKTSPPKSTT